MRLQYALANVQGLANELAAMSFLVRTRDDGEREARFVVTFDGQTVYLDVPDDLTPEQVAEIEQVVMAHNPS